MSDKEVTACIKINKLLEAAGWRFLTDGNTPANIRLEPSVTIKSADLDVLGDNFEKTSMGCRFSGKNPSNFPNIPLLAFRL